MQVFIRYFAVQRARRPPASTPGNPERSTEPTSGSANLPDPGPECGPDEHAGHRARGPAVHDGPAFERAVRVFKALGDVQRLRLLELLVRGEACVSELAAAMDENVPAVSQRLRLLRAEDLVRGRRDGKHVFYTISDGHVAALVLSALDHAAEPDSTS